MVSKIWLSCVSWYLRAHYFELFKSCLAKLDFVDLDGLLNKRTIKAGVIGRYCYYVGGLYGKRPQFPITEEAEPTHLYFRRRSFFVEWLLDPRLLTSSTAATRLSDRTVYIVYGVIRSTDEKDINGKEFMKLDIRPYVFGLPTERKDRLPYLQISHPQDVA